MAPAQKQHNKIAVERRANLVIVSAAQLNSIPKVQRRGGIFVESRIRNVTALKFFENGFRLCDDSRYCCRPLENDPVFVNTSALSDQNEPDCPRTKSFELNQLLSVICN